MTVVVTTGMIVLIVLTSHVNRRTVAQRGGHAGIACFKPWHIRRDAVEPRMDLLELVRIRKVGLVDHDQIGRLDLPLQRIGQQRIGRLARDRGRIDQHDDRIQIEGRVRAPDLRDLPRVGYTAGFDHDRIERRLRLDHADQRRAQVVADRAAHAAVGQLDRIGAALRDQCGVDVQRAEVVD